MAKKLLCIVLSVAMLLGVVAVSATAAVGDHYGYTPETAAEELLEKYWELEYDADLDWKDEIDRRWLTGATEGYYDEPAEVAAPQEILEKNLSFWADEIVEAYNSAASNEDYWTLYNKMATPMVVNYEYEEDGEIVIESDILYDYGYFYRDESKATVELDIVADTEYAKAGDIITVEVYATSNFLTQWFFGGIFYDKQYLKPLTLAYNTAGDPTWTEKSNQLDLAVVYDQDGNITFDRRADYWPKDFYTEENLNKYGISYLQLQGDNSLGKFNYTYGRQFNGELLFTATYEVKEDVPEGTELEFFVADNSVASMKDLLHREEDLIESVFSFYHLIYSGLTAEEFDVTADAHCNYDQSVIANTAVVTVGEEPAPAVKGEIVDVYLSEAYVGDVTEVDIEVTGSPEALHFMEADGGYKRVARDTATIIEFNGNELWTVDLFVEDELLEYTVYADYGELGSTDGKEFVIVGQLRKDLSIHSIEIPDMYPDAQNGGMIVAGKHDIIIKTSTDVVKIQFYGEDGTTYTYTSWSGAGKMPYEDIDGERVWTISHAFGPFGYQSLVIRTRAESTFFTSTGSTLDATVVY